MEPFIPIPGKPPRQVVIDRQRKLFASLSIEELLLELVGNLNFNSLILNLGHRLFKSPKAPSRLATLRAFR